MVRVNEVIEGLGYSWEYIEETAQSMMEGIVVSQPQIVRCRDCKHYHKGFNCDLMQKPVMKTDDYFCADGEAKDDA